MLIININRVISYWCLNDKHFTFSSSMFKYYVLWIISGIREEFVCVSVNAIQLCYWAMQNCFLVPCVYFIEILYFKWSNDQFAVGHDWFSFKFWWIIVQLCVCYVDDINQYRLGVRKKICEAFIVPLFHSAQILLSSIILQKRCSN